MITPYVESAKALRALLHTMPEFAMHETNTRRALTEYLRRETDLQIIDCGDWFYARFNGDPSLTKIALRADYDAVPCADGTCRHLCGHDGHAAVLAALGKWISDEHPKRSVVLLFQPGEETGEGAQVCAELAWREHVSEIYGMHNIPGYPLGNVLVTGGTFACASVGLSIRLSGTPAHAAYPEMGHNPGETFAALITMIGEYVRRPHRGILLSTVIGMDMGSTNYGVSASEGVLRLTVRAEYTNEFNALLDFIHESVRSLATKNGLRHEITRHDPFPATENHAKQAAHLRAAVEGAGLRAQQLRSPFRWSEDFGRYLQKTPGAFFGMGAGEQWPEIHTEAYEYNDELIPFALTALRALCDAE